MGYLADIVAGARCTERRGGENAGGARWHEATMAQWLVGMPPSFAVQRLAMVDAIRPRLSGVSDRLGGDCVERALQAMAIVPRESFVCPLVDDLAYLPMPLDIGLDQIISHPELVAVLAAAAAPRGGHVLDVGTGSGYQAAVLALLADSVTSMEILAGHADLARFRLRRLRFDNVQVVTGDAGAPGLFGKDSFDAIVVAAGAAATPPELLAALKIGGRLVMPLGATPDDEDLVLIDRIDVGEWRHTVLRPAKFVPLTGYAARRNHDFSGQE